MAAADDVTSKALTLHNVQASFHGTGSITIEGVMNCQAGRTTDPSDPLDILSGNAHFHGLDYEKAVKVIEAIPECAVLFGEHHIVPEADFDRLLNEIPGADNTKTIKAGNMKRNDMGVGRQRFCIIGATLFAFRAERLAAKVAEDALLKNQAKEKKDQQQAGKKRKVQGGDGSSDDQVKKKAARKCSNPLCMKPMPEGGNKCETTGCLLRFCAACQTAPFYTSHRMQCIEVQKQKKAEKNAEKNK